jgi:hypothetical protein
MRILLIIFSIFSFNIIAQIKSYTEMEKTLISIVSTQWAHDKIITRHRQYSKSPGDTLLMIEDYRFISEIKSIDVRQFNLEKIYSKNNFHLYQCYMTGSAHPEMYIMGYNSNRIYLIKNFWIDELSDFIADLFGTVDENEVQEVLSLINSAYYNYYILIDSTNYKKYQAMYEEVKPVYIKKLNKAFKLIYYLHAADETLLVNELFIYTDGKIKLESIVLREPF